MHSSYAPKMRLTALLMAGIFGFYSVHPTTAFAVTAASGDRDYVMENTSVKTPDNIVKVDGVQWDVITQAASTENVARAESASFAAGHADRQNWSSIFADTDMANKVSTAESVISDIFDNSDGSHQVILYIEFKDALGAKVGAGLANYRIQSESDSHSVAYMSLAYTSQDKDVSGSITTIMGSDSKVSSLTIKENVHRTGYDAKLSLRKGYAADGTQSLKIKTLESHTAETDGTMTDLKVSDTTNKVNRTLITTTSKRNSRDQVLSVVNSNKVYSLAGALVSETGGRTDMAYDAVTGARVSLSVTNTVIDEKTSLPVVKTQTNAFDASGKATARVDSESITKVLTDGTQEVKTVTKSLTMDPAGQAVPTKVAETMTELRDSQGKKLSAAIATVKYQSEAVVERASEDAKYLGGVLAQSVKKIEAIERGAVKEAVTEIKLDDKTFKLASVGGVMTLKEIETDGSESEVTGVDPNLLTDPDVLQDPSDLLDELKDLDGGEYDSDGYSRTTGYHRETGFNRDGYDIRGNRRMMHPDGVTVKSYYNVDTKETTNYDTAGVRTTVVEADGTTHTYDLNGTFKARTNKPNGAWWSYYPDGVALKTSYDPTTRDTTSFNSNGQISRIEEASGTIHTFVLGVRSQSDYANGERKTYQSDGVTLKSFYDTNRNTTLYDVAGKKTRMIEYNGPTHLYDGNEVRTQTNYLNGDTATYQPDGVTRATFHEAATDKTTTYRPDGTREKTVDPRGNWTEWQPDGQQPKKSYDAASKKTTDHRPDGTREKVTDVDGNTWSYGSNGTTLVSSYVAETGETTFWRPDATREFMVDASGNKHTFSADGKVRTRTDYPATKSWMTYQKDGETPAVFYDGEKEQTTYFNGDGSKDRMVEKDGTVHSYFSNMEILVQRPNGDWSSFYYPSGNMREDFKKATGVRTGFYDEIGQDGKPIISTIYGPGAKELQYSRYGRLTKVVLDPSEPSREGAVQYDLDNNGRVSSMVLANGDRITRTYLDSLGSDTDLRLMSEVVTHANGDPGYTMNYQQVFATNKFLYGVPEFTDSNHVRALYSAILDDLGAENMPADASTGFKASSAQLATADSLMDWLGQLDTLNKFVTSTNLMSIIAAHDAKQDEEAKKAEEKGLPIPPVKHLMPSLPEDMQLMWAYELSGYAGQNYSTLSGNIKAEFREFNRRLMDLIWSVSPDAQPKGTQVYSYQYAKEVQVGGRTVNCQRSDCLQYIVGDVQNGWVDPLARTAQQIKDGVKGEDEFDSAAIGFIEAETGNVAHRDGVVGDAVQLDGVDLASNTSYTIDKTSWIKVVKATNYTELASQIRSLADLGMKVINLSLEILDTGDDALNKVIMNAIYDATSYANGKGAMVVASAGNSGGLLSLVARVANIISVGAVDYAKRLMGFSAVGAGLDFVSYGQNILSLDTTKTNKIANWSGTSFSAPTLALLLGKMIGWDMLEHGQMVDGKLVPGRRTVSDAQLLQIIKMTAEDLGIGGRDNYFGNGLVNPGKAFNLFKEMLANGGLPTVAGNPFVTEKAARVAAEDSAVQKARNDAAIRAAQNGDDAGGDDSQDSIIDLVINGAQTFFANLYDNFNNLDILTSTVDAIGGIIVSALNLYVDVFVDPTTGDPTTTDTTTSDTTDPVTTDTTTTDTTTDTTGNGGCPSTEEDRDGDCFPDNPDTTTTDTTMTDPTTTDTTDTTDPTTMEPPVTTDVTDTTTDTTDVTTIDPDEAAKQAARDAAWETMNQADGKKSEKEQAVGSWEAQERDANDEKQNAESQVKDAELRIPGLKSDLAAAKLDLAKKKTALETPEAEIEKAQDEKNNADAELTAAQQNVGNAAAARAEATRLADVASSEAANLRGIADSLRANLQAQMSEEGPVTQDQVDQAESEAKAAEQRAVDALAEKKRLEDSAYEMDAAVASATTKVQVAEQKYASAVAAANSAMNDVTAAENAKMMAEASLQMAEEELASAQTTLAEADKKLNSIKAELASAKSELQLAEQAYQDASNKYYAMA